MIEADPFANIQTPPLRPPLAQPAPGDPSPAGVMQSGLDSFRPAPDPEPAPSYSEGGAVNVVQSDGKLIKVVSHSTATAPDTYPEELHVEVGDLLIDIDADGVTVADAASGNWTRITATGAVEVHNDTNTAAVTIDPADLADDITINKDGVKVENATSGNFTQVANTGIVTMHEGGAGKELTIDPEDVTENMTVTEWDCCDSGSPAKALFISSAPYAP
jgi:hypothetical protein